MRRKLVLWGANEKDEKMLVALELLEKENVVNIYTFPENVATEDFYKMMSEKWKDDIEVEFPNGFTKIERKLSMTDSILPDEIKVEHKLNGMLWFYHQNFMVCTSQSLKNSRKK